MPMLEKLGRAILKIFFREIVIEGRDRLPAHGPVIFTPNHPNLLIDPLLIWFLAPSRRIRFVAKAALFEVPILGWIMRRLRTVPVTRRMDAAGQVDYTVFFATCVESLAGGDSLVIFPEGRSLPQPTMAPLRTGPARMFFLARGKGVKANIVPVGLNYEHGAVFRSSVLVSVAAPIDTRTFERTHGASPAEAVRDLTGEIGRSLEHHLFQAETFRDRKLMLLVERLYAGEATGGWAERVPRLKEFERGLTRLRKSHPKEIENLRRLLASYERLTAAYSIEEGVERGDRRGGVRSTLIGVGGMLVAGLGWLINWVPYRACALLVKRTGLNRADAATYKIVYSSVLFPLAYLAEGALIEHWAGWTATALFAVTVGPLTYFTLRFFEWRGEIAGRSRKASAWFTGPLGRHAARRLSQLRERIVAEVERLAAHLEPETDAEKG